MRISPRLVTLITFLVLGISSAFAVEKQDYKTGDTLKKESANALSSIEPYKKLNWDELTPADWDPLKPLKGLDLNKLKDSDPRAIEAMDKLREAWNNAPIVPALNGTRVKVAGFVVPLDIDRHKVKEFLLVPYFGACIHVPPPPGNQIIHILTTKSLTDDQNEMLKKALLLQGPVFVNGVLETVPSDTDMGFAGYSMKAEIIEPYRAPETK